MEPFSTWVTGRWGSAKSGCSFKTWAIRRALARLMVSMTKTMESIIRLISTLST